MTRIGKKIKATFTRRSARKSPRTASPSRALNRTSVQRFLNVAAWLLVAGGLGAGWVYGVPRFEENIACAHASRRDEGALEVRFINAPEWVMSNASLCR